MTRHAQTRLRHAVTPLPASMPLASAKLPVAPTPASTDGPGPDPRLKLFPIIAPRLVGVDRTGHRGALPTAPKPLSP